MNDWTEWTWMDMETEGLLGTKMLFSDKIQIVKNWISFSWVQQLRITRLTLIGCLLATVHKKIFLSAIIPSLEILKINFRFKKWKNAVFVTVIKIGCLTRYSEMARFFGYQYMTVIIVCSAETRTQPSIQPLHSNLEISISTACLLFQDFWICCNQKYLFRNSAK